MADKPLQNKENGKRVDPRRLTPRNFERHPNFPKKYDSQSNEDYELIVIEYWHNWSKQQNRFAKKKYHEKKRLMRKMENMLDLVRQGNLSDAEFFYSLLQYNRLIFHWNQRYTPLKQLTPSEWRALHNQNCM